MQLLTHACAMRMDRTVQRWGSNTFHASGRRPLAASRNTAKQSTPRPQALAASRQLSGARHVPER